MEDTKQPKKRIYCAIYTRKSSSEGLDQDFTSLDAQREAAENYIRSQKHEGWITLPEQYNDGGFTGANTDRPGLQTLLSDIKSQRINCVVVYKVDRLSRSLTDFVQLLELFDKYGVTFVSVTQSFNTNTSMGRLTLNILLSFAQFEREIARERTKDKMSALRKKGQWTGGIVPLGYKLDELGKRFLIDPEGASVVREIFDLYLKGKSTLEIVHLFQEKDYRTNKIQCQSGKVLGGVRYSVARLQWILRNPLYAGKIRYEGEIYDGEHEAIISEETFRRTQELMDANHRVRKPKTKHVDCTGLLTSLLHCKICGTYMTHTYSCKKKEGRKYLYYICTNAQKFGHTSCPTRSINSKQVEDAVIDHLREIFRDRRKRDRHTFKEEINLLCSPGWDTLYPLEKRRILKILLKQVDYSKTAKKLGITLADNGLRLEFDADLKQTRPAKRRWAKERELEKQPRLRKTLILAYQLQKILEDGQTTAKQAAKWLNMHEVRIDQILNFLMLSPKIQEEIICSENRVSLAIPEYKLRPVMNEVDWHKQDEMWRELLQNQA